MAEKSLDDRIKEAELAKLKSEDAKVKAETALARKQLDAKWYSGKSLAQITALVLTVVAVYTAIDRIFLSELKQKEARLARVETKLFRAEVDSLNRAKESITTTIDSLFLESKNFRFDTPEELKSALKQYRMIKAKDYFDTRLNPAGKDIENKFDIRVVAGDTVIYDAATGLTWQGGSAFPGRLWEAAQDSVKNLVYAGYDDWRLPTLGEAMSLMEPIPQDQGMFVNPLFNDTLFIWTSDKYGASRAWVVDFDYGYCNCFDIDNVSYRVRAVR